MKKTLLALLITSSQLFAADWPIYKGNLYFTGNNDEIIVRGNRIRWIFRAKARVLNPIISDKRLYFLDLRKNVYSIDEDTGSLYWKINLKQLSRQFVTSKRAFGKPKYPVIMGKYLYLSDPSVIYCLDKKTGQVRWARTGMRNETNLGRHSIARVDGIYSNVMAVDGKIHYGTRNVFMARDERNGHLLWKNDSIKTFSAFPTFYDKYIFTQSVKHAQKLYEVICLDRRSGKELWRKAIDFPFKIFAPVVYQNKVLVPTGKKMFALAIEDGRTVWQKEYPGIISSNPSFTDREILFTVNNQNLLIVNGKTGELKYQKTTPQPSSVKFVTIRDQVYYSHTIYKNKGGRKTPYTRLVAADFERKTPSWVFEPPFAGGPSQHVAGGGVLFLPAGNHLYALGKNTINDKTGDDYLKKIVTGKTTGDDSDSSIDNDQNTADSDKPVDDGKDNKLVDNQIKKEEVEKKIVDETRPVKPVKKENTSEQKKIPQRKVKIEIKDGDGKKIPAVVEVVKRYKKKIVYRKKYIIDKNTDSILIPNDDGIEITTNAKDHLPDKTIVNKNDKKIDITLKRIKKGASINLSSIHFRSGKAYLRESSLDILSKMAAVMKRQPGLKLKIVGHTDSRGSKKYNQRLSEKRAEAVRDYLVKQGISPVRLRAAGAGENRPIASNKTARGRAKNRRTEFIVLEN